MDEAEIAVSPVSMDDEEETGITVTEGIIRRWYEEFWRLREEAAGRQSTLEEPLRRWMEEYIRMSEECDRLFGQLLCRSDKNHSSGSCIIARINISDEEIWRSIGQLLCRSDKEHSSGGSISARWVISDADRKQLLIYYEDLETEYTRAMKREGSQHKLTWQRTAQEIQAAIIRGVSSPLWRQWNIREALMLKLRPDQSTNYLPRIINTQPPERHNFIPISKTRRASPHASAFTHATHTEFDECFARDVQVSAIEKEWAYLNNERMEIEKQKANLTKLHQRESDDEPDIYKRRSSVYRVEDANDDLLALEARVHKNEERMQRANKAIIERITLIVRQKAYSARVAQLEIQSVAVFGGASVLPAGGGGVAGGVVAGGSCYGSDAKTEQN